MSRIKVIDEQILRENRQQFKNKISKVIDKLRSKNGVNGPNMWEVVRRLKKKKSDYPTAIKDKDGTILEDKEKLKKDI